jgi:pilus assembly protein Flp/PilA
MGVHKELFVDLLIDETGQDMIEYIFIAALIGLAAIVAMTGLTTKIGTLFNTIGSVVTNNV